MSKKLFITGTGTDVGKTFVSGLIIKKLSGCGKNAAYFKAAMSGNIRNPDGCLIPGDAIYVKNVSCINQSIDTMCPYVYQNAYSPHLASRIEGNPVKIGVVQKCFETLSKQYDYITAEGSGGITCPICFDESKIMLEDIIKKLHMPCLIVADAGLGTINNVVLTVFYMHQKNIPIKGIIFNHFHPGNIMEEDNIKMCEYLTGVKALACVKENDTELDIDIQLLESLYE